MFAVIPTAGTTQKTSLIVFCGKRVLDLLFNILDRDKTLQVEILIHDRKFLLSCLCQGSLLLLPV